MKITNLIILLFLGPIVFSQTRAEKIDSISQTIHNKNPEVAMSIGFIDNGKEYFFNYGTISRQSKVEVDENTIYEIGSITKLLTANLVAQAQIEKKLNIDDFIDEYLPNDYKLSDNIRNKIKISDLASHQSGLPDLDFEKLMKLRPKQPLDVNKETIQSIINDSTKLSDYGNYRYSNISYALLGMILEKAYKQDFEKILRENILSPAQMSNTYTTEFNVKNKVTGYDMNGVEQDYFNWNPLTASAGLLKSNTTDMTKFLKILLSNSGQISKATEITENTYYKNTNREVGLGQEIANIKEDTFFYKTGDTFSGSSIIAYDKKSNWGIIILINQHNSDLMRELINNYYEKVLE